MLLGPKLRNWYSSPASSRSTKPANWLAKATSGLRCARSLTIWGRALLSEGLGFTNVTKFTAFLVHSQDVEGFMAVRKELFAKIYPGGQYPPNTLVMVDRLVGEQFLIEVEAIAAVS
jgi:enamine deaminase RidA (YjgF/YER057c/UK114 family)